MVLSEQPAVLCTSAVPFALSLPFGISDRLTDLIARADCTDSSSPFVYRLASSFPCFIEDTHRLTTFPLPAPEPAGAVAPAPPTAVSAQTPSTDAPAATEAEPTEAPAQAAEPAAAAPSANIPAVPTTKPAPGMSATSGPLDEPDFGGEQKVEPTAAPVTAAAPVAAAPVPTATAPAEK
jgi:hypothetical protein